MLSFERLSSGGHPLTKCQQNKESRGTRATRGKLFKKGPASCFYDADGACKYTSLYTQCANDGLETRGSLVQQLSVSGAQTTAGCWLKL